MNNFFSQIKKRLSSRHTVIKYIVSIVFILFLTVSVNNAFSKQVITVPKNPIEDFAENSSHLQLSGHNKELIFTEDVQENNQKELENKPEEQHEKDNQKKGEADQETEQDQINEKEQSKEESSEQKANENPEDSAGNGEGGLNSDNKNDPDSSFIEIVSGSAKDTNNNEYFTTSIIDNETVTVEEFAFVIKQKEHSYLVKQTHVYVNEQLDEEFKGSVTLSEGQNAIKINITYEDEEGKHFIVSRQYTVHYKENEIVIYTSLEEEMEVTKEVLIFTARAESNGEAVDVKVALNGDSLKLTSDKQYESTVKKGKNIITISADDREGNKEEKEYIILFDPKETTIEIETDLRDQDVTTEKFTFQAAATDGGKDVELIVEHEGNVIAGDGNYELTLQEGENDITLTAGSGNDSVIQKYVVSFVKPAGQEESDAKEDEKAPTIKTDLKDGMTKNGTIITMDVMPVDYEGTRIRGSKVSVTVNGVGVPYTWDDSTKTSYKLVLKDGENKVVVTAWDDEGRTSSLVYTVYGTAVEDGGQIGTATISIEASTVGLGYLIPPTKVDIHQGKPTSYILDELLSDYGFGYEFTGAHENNFYLSVITKENLVTNPSIPEDLAQLVEEASDFYDPESYHVNSLGEFDFANGSGWMYSVNGSYPNFGFADSYLNDGDVVRVRFTLHYGKDIGGYGGMGQGSGGDWYKEW
ncbi:DUF4430 domain-containing protein [Bacillus sp. AGMB 02131]|uniref:DUF4430 domain-containing protein n=1 Tax=Peribacillus faecalis TaxID=2772559 RepID=A0A927CXD0_9BACI|nr:DUF4430 domain-containing protein [Peribacillus faecalis]MBD3107400.1 DUF4430 domain-containing protein [Peribacillus faecalis]